MKKFVFAILFLVIISALAQAQTEPAEALRDVKGPVDLPFEFLVALLVLAIAAAVAALVGGVIFLRKYLKKKEAVVPPEPPWSIAQRQLQALKQANLPAQGKIKEYYTRLSDIARRYIEGRFGINAPDKTTEEFLWSLKEMSEFSLGQKQALMDFLNCCDMVKFAKYSSESQEMEKSFGLIEKIVQETIIQEKQSLGTDT